MKRDPDATRAKLLTAARDEFAEHGIAGARVDRIADRAGVNKERIYGHFGNKEALFGAVMRHELTARADALGPPEGDLAEFVGRVYDYHRSHPELLRLFQWEALHHGADVERDDPRADHYAESIDRLTAQLDDPHHETDRSRARALLLTLIGMGSWPAAVPQLTGLIYGRERPDQLRDDLVALARHLVGHTTTGVAR